MRNSEIADMFYDIADMLEMQNVDFKPNAYRKAARSIQESAQEIQEIYQKGGEKALQEALPGVGKNLAEKLAELLTTGKLSYYQDLRKQFPKHIIELMEVPGLGPKRIQLLHEKLGISTLGQLERAARSHKIRELGTFGEKSEEDILRGIALLKGGRDRLLLGYALPTAIQIERMLQELPSVAQASMAGSLRRRKETIGDIDLLVASSEPRKVMEVVAHLPNIREVLARGNTKLSILLRSGLQVDVRVVEEESFGSALQYFTGSKEHNVALRDFAAKRGFKLNEYGLFRLNGTTEKKVVSKTESEVYKALGMAYIEPELRENQGEIEAALQGRLPSLIGYTNSIRGDMHAHTNRTDGSHSIEQMALAAKALGYQYLALTDHSKSTRIAHGLTEEGMLAHIKQMRSVRVDGIRVLAGSEVDILPNGELDFPEEILKKLDVVVGSVHSRFKSTREEMTERILAALENPYLDILGHPTGRLIGKREPYDVNLKKIFEKAAQKNVFLEINANPARSDLSDAHAREAKKHGCRFVIDTDAHSTSELGFMHLGISIARRAWLTSKDVVNSASLKELPLFFKRIKEQD